MVGGGGESRPRLGRILKLAFGASCDGVTAYPRLILAHVREQDTVIDVPRRVEPATRHVRDATGVVHFQPIARLQRGGFESNVLGIRNTAGGDQNFVRFDALPVPPDLHWGAGSPALDARYIYRCVYRYPQAGKLSRDCFAHKRFQAFQQPSATIEQRDFLAAQRAIGLSELARHGPAAEYG